MKKYLIHERKAGAQTDKLLELVPIFADNPDEAAERFTEWVLTWMGNDNSESAIAETAELREYIAASGNIYDYSFDGVSYWFEEEPEPAPETFTCERCGSEAPADECFRVLIDPEDGHSDRIEICLDCYAETKGTTYYVDTVAGTMTTAAGDDVTDQFFGMTSPADPGNTPDRCLDFWMSERWIMFGDVVKWDGVQVYPAPDPLADALDSITRDANISPAFRDGLKGEK